MHCTNDCLLMTCFISTTRMVSTIFSIRQCLCLVGIQAVPVAGDMIFYLEKYCLGTIKRMLVYVNIGTRREYATLAYNKEHKNMPNIYLTLKLSSSMFSDRFRYCDSE